MTGPEIIALASVIASGVVGLTVGFGGPIVNALQQRKAEHLRYIREQRARSCISTSAIHQLPSLSGINAGQGLPMAVGAACRQHRPGLIGGHCLEGEDR